MTANYSPWHGGSPRPPIGRASTEPPSVFAGAGGPLDRIVHGEAVTAAENIEESAGYRTRAEFRDMADRSGYRSLLNVALRKEGTLLGAITIFRKEAGIFSEQQIALLQNFATQAVIAMENARLLGELRQRTGDLEEALEQQTATAAVLGVINSSPGDLTPVFDAILEKAHSLCEADYGALLTYDGERFWPLAGYGASAGVADAISEGIPNTHGSFPQLLRGERFVHIHDMAELARLNPDNKVWQALVGIGGIRTQLMVPLRKDDALLGVITANRKEIRPVTHKQITVWQSFAPRAVIAMENARLLTETREALEQQTATAEVLGVINASPGDLAPVFQSMLEKALRLCDAAFGTLWTARDDSAHEL